MLRPLSEFEFRHLSKIKNGRHKQRSGQHTLAAKKFTIQKNYDCILRISVTFLSNLQAESVLCMHRQSSYANTAARELIFPVNKKTEA